MLSMKNAPAYFDRASVKKKKFLTKTHGVVVIRFFFFVSTQFLIKLECLSLTSLRGRSDLFLWTTQPGNTKGGKYHCTIDLLFDWFGFSCLTTDTFCFYLQNILIQTSQTGGQWYRDTGLDSAV